MKTFNVSLPENLANKIDSMILAEGYASRSEFFRTVARLYLDIKLASQDKSEANFFVPFCKKPLSKVKKDLDSTGKYNKKFIDSVIKGLEKSSYYANKSTTKKY